MSSRRNSPRSSSSRPNPPCSSRFSSLSLPSPPPSAPLTAPSASMASRASSPAPSASSGPGSPTSVDLNELEAAVAASRSIPRLALDPPVLTLEPPTSPESGERHQRIPTSPPHSLSVASPRPAAKHQWGISTTAKKGKAKDKVTASSSASTAAPPQKSQPLLSPNLWASLLSASSSTSAASSASSSSSALPLSSSSTTASASSSATSSLPSHTGLLPGFPSVSSPLSPATPLASSHSPSPPVMAPLPASTPLPSALPSSLLPAPHLSSDQVVLSLLQHQLNSLVANQSAPVLAPSSLLLALLPTSSSALKAQVHGLPPADPALQLDPNDLIDHGLVVHILKEGWQTYFPINSLSADLTHATLHYVKAPTEFDIASKPSISYPNFCEAARMLPVLIGRHLNSPFKAEIA
ncbi:hypothetical protein CY34DRAFT_18470 [Suillus luteus UH-Slu-Lm8-n1]|uniref:Uncharacterized protein n=1 Tax=Suillus luteus UH-Slu-Lm8-n1 TaxID=930992 RepID=A0A0D0A4W9_9AGAM|nr:hypothetical protein CY34DRAFT_18470 [Suillus luteus UH-Slu-Lm8-n1]